MRCVRAGLCAVAAVVALGAGAHNASAQRAPDAAVAQDVGAVLARVEAARAGVRSIEADFDEERTMGLFAQTLHATGRLVVMPPDRVRWETVTPDPGVFVVDGARVSYRAGGSGAAATRSQLGALGAMQGDLATFLGGRLAPLASRYRFSASTGDGGAVVLAVVPTDPAVARVLSRMTLTFAPDLRSIARVVLEEPGGDRASIALRNVRVNSGRVTAAMFAVP